MIEIKEVDLAKKDVIDSIVAIHMEAFPGFFLTFMGRKFLKQMYSSYCEHNGSGFLVAEKHEKVIGFLAYSCDFSGLYKYMIKKHLVRFAFYSIGAFLRRPNTFFHIMCAFFKPQEVKRDEKYVELSSIGVLPKNKSKGVGTMLIDELKNNVDFEKFEYITLETDAVDNEYAIHFYEKNAFVKKREYKTNGGREMFEYRYYN